VLVLQATNVWARRPGYEASDNAISCKTVATGNYTHWYQTIHNLWFVHPRSINCDISHMTKYPRLSPFLRIFVRMWESLGTRLVLSVTLPSCSLAQTFVTCSTNVKGWIPEMKYCYQATMVAVFATFIGGGTCNNIPKINITIVQSYTGNISLICCLWHCCSCCTLSCNNATATTSQYT